MTRQKLSFKSKFKNYLNFLAVIVVITLVILLFSQKKNLNETITKLSYQQSLVNNDSALKELIQEKYNYSGSLNTFELTFLEFGAKGCISCIKMEKVMEEVKAKYPALIKVEFINMLTDSGRVLGKYYSVLVIPCQILLDKEGNEFYRHIGYLAFDDLQQKLFSDNIKADN